MEILKEILLLFRWLSATAIDLFAPTFNKIFPFSLEIHESLKCTKCMQYFLRRGTPTNNKYINCETSPCGPHSSKSQNPNEKFIIRSINYE